MISDDLQYLGGAKIVMKIKLQAHRGVCTEYPENTMPAFLAAFSKSKKLSKSEVEQLQAMIDSYQEE